MTRNVILRASCKERELLLFSALLALEFSGSVQGFETGIGLWNCAYTSTRTHW